MSLVKIQDDLEIEIIDEQDLEEAKKLLLEIFCIEEAQEGGGADSSIKNGLASQLTTLISIYNGNYEIPLCDGGHLI